MDILRLVDSLVRKYNTRNPFEIINNLNVIVVFYPLKGVKGFYQYFQRNNIIYIDNNLSEAEQKVVCAHELGHMFLHKKCNAIFMDSRTHFVTNKYENEANTFAAELLIPDDSFNEYETIQNIASLHKVPIELVELKCKKLI